MEARTQTVAHEAAPVRRGRKRDASRDGEILDAALAVLAEVGYEGMTMGAVAARAKAGKATVYRRWPSKENLVLDAVARMEHQEVARDRLPDTGTLRSDLIAMMGPSTLVEGERRLKVMAGLVSLLSRDPQLAEAANAAIVEPWVVANRALLQQAVDRGEIPAAADVEILSQIIPSMAAYRVFLQRRPLNRDFLSSLIDGVLLPAIRGAGPP